MTVVIGSLRPFLYAPSGSTAVYLHGLTRSAKGHPWKPTWPYMLLVAWIVQCSYSTSSFKCLHNVTGFWKTSKYEIQGISACIWWYFSICVCWFLVCFSILLIIWALNSVYIVLWNILEYIYDSFVNDKCTEITFP